MVNFYKPSRIPFVIVLFYQVLITLLFISKSLDHLRLVLVSGEILAGSNYVFAVTHLTRSSGRSHLPSALL
jgi:hypothetical protein